MDFFGKARKKLIGAALGISKTFWDLLNLGDMFSFDFCLRQI